MTLTIVLICFFILLTLSMPIALLLAATTAIYLIFIAHVPVTSLIQQLFNGLDNFVLLGVPFFILAGNIMAEGAISDRFMKLLGRFTGGLRLAALFGVLSLRPSLDVPYNSYGKSSIKTSALIRRLQVIDSLRGCYTARFSGISSAQ